ncbi:MAG: hypothetical protein CVV42_00405 [Candidatus Riflebacteria bacterium HGW-Riflebacteria-2]|jgi:hypothetical protein|nr:MAG: hypothetical protein CVV42_00405 [Candidatus Riflebacteria bacterium HGW-Riflebacteria-2]
MKRILSVVLVFVLVSGLTAFEASAQSRRDDIPVKQLPAGVLNVLYEYAEVLKSETLEKCAEAFVAIAGGGLVNEAGDALRGDVPQFSLKKDFRNFRFYAMPLKITRVNKRRSNGDGYGESAIAGWVYKIWIAKKKGVNGMPAPISIMVPENHPTIKTPKVIGIGSL